MPSHAQSAAPFALRGPGQLMRALLLVVACLGLGQLLPAAAQAASPLPAGPLNTTSGMARDGRIAAGLSHTCAIKTDGTPVCWGSNVATQIPAGTGAVSQISAGFAHTCAIKIDGTPVCWGNSSGPATVPAGIGTVTQIAAGALHTCALKTDGTPACWGSNADGQTTIPAGLGTVSQLAVGASHTCALTTPGALVCWGANASGQTRARIDGTPPAWIGDAPLSFRVQGSPQRGFSVAGGALPDGLDIDDTGLITGTPTKEGSYTATLTSSADQFPASATKEVTIGVDLTKPATTDDVPGAPQPGPIGVTLEATDAGGSGVDRTTYEILSVDGTPGPTKVYAPAGKPMLGAGERIRYRSLDAAGNAEADRTSRALTVVPPPTPTPSPAPVPVPLPLPTIEPAPLPTLLPQTAPIITATLGADGKGR